MIPTVARLLCSYALSKPCLWRRAQLWRCSAPTTRTVPHARRVGVLRAIIGLLGDLVVSTSAEDLTLICSWLVCAQPLHNAQASRG